MRNSKILALTLCLLLGLSRPGWGQEPAQEQPAQEEPAQEEPAEEEPNQGAIGNPLKPMGDSLDRLIEEGQSQDFWRAMVSGLPCSEATTQCLRQLGETAVSRSPLLREIDTRIEEAETRVAEAAAANKGSIALDILTPALKAYLSWEQLPGDAAAAKPYQVTQLNPTTGKTETVTITPQATGDRSPLSKILSIFSRPGKAIGELLGLIGLPIAERLLGGGSSQARQAAIAVTDLQIKIAELKRQRSELADRVRGAVVPIILGLEESKVQYVLETELTNRAKIRLGIYRAKYSQGEGSTEAYLENLSNLDKQKARAYQAWAGVRSRLAQLKLAVLGQSDD